MKRTPFRNILIANRGEIALRIMRTAAPARLSAWSRSIRMRTRDALHVRVADEAVRIGEALSAQSYLQIDAIIAAATAARRRRDSSGLRLSCGKRGFRQRLPGCRHRLHRAVARSYQGDGRQGHARKRHHAGGGRSAAFPVIRAPPEDAAMLEEAKNRRVSRDDQGGRRRRRSRYPAWLQRRQQFAGLVAQRALRGGRRVRRPARHLEKAIEAVRGTSKSR